MIQIEVINTCNLRCRYCNRGTESSLPRTGPRKLTYAEFERILAQLLTLRPAVTNDRFAFCGLSEALMHPELLTLLKCPLLKQFQTIDLTTNGMLLTPAMFDAIERILPQIIIRISLQSARREVMEHLQTGACFDTVVTHTRYAAQNAHKIRLLRIQSLRTPQTTAETEQDFERLLGIRFKNARHVQFRQKLGMQLTTQRGVDGLPPANTLCAGYGTNIIINAHGDLTGCCWDCTREQVYGNIFEQELTDIRSNKLREQRQAALAAKDWTTVPVCKRCLTGSGI